MSLVFFSKKIPSVKAVFLSSSGFFSSSSQLVPFSIKKHNSLRDRHSHEDGNLQTRFHNLSQTSPSSHFKQALVICDKRFQFSPLLKKWKKNKKLKFYYVRSGEKTKSLEQLPQHIQKINSLIFDFDKKATLFIGIGGGSVIDLTGFLASIYKRGLPVVFIPSTWLSALDSAHGGKNAVNFKNVKNLLGTYHFPKAVFIVEELLKQNPNELKQQAYGELLKIAFIKGGIFYKNLYQLGIESHSPSTRQKPPRKSHSVGSHEKPRIEFKNSTDIKREHFIKPKINIQKFIQMAIESKMEIIKKDPFEIKGERKKLNLGHTVGHILEAVKSLPHGLAVLHGLLFSLNWSYHKGFLSKKHFKEMKNLILLNKMDLSFPADFGDSHFRGKTEQANKSDSFSEKSKRRIGKSNPVGIKGKKISLSLFRHYLRQDKKHKIGLKIDFVFIKKPGQVFVESVLETGLIKEAKRQSLIY